MWQSLGRGASAGISTSFNIFAKWATVDYTVSYLLNGGSGIAPTETVKTYGVTFSVKSIGSSTKTGYDFAGWNDGTITYQPNATYTVGSADIFLTAQCQCVDSQPL